MQKEIRRTWFFSRHPEDVWKHLTEPELLEQWLSKTDFQPIVGHKFHFVSPYGNDSYCEVLEVDPFARLSYTWRKNSVKDNRPFDSTVMWTVVQREGGTELQLVHSGFRAEEDAVAHENGWRTCFKKFEESLNTICDDSTNA